MKDIRSLYLVLSPTSLPYAKFALESLWKQSVESLHLHLITDGEQDKEALTGIMQALPAGGADGPLRRWSVYAEQDLAEREADTFARLPHLRAFRRGHPCWRKITDPLLLSQPGEEMILLDPDLFFPNRFSFEATPQEGLLLMWQKPNCLLPHSVVKAAMDARVALANHVDIGVAHWRGPADIEWLDWLIGMLGGERMPRVMHIEAIIWAALAMRMGGGHLDPNVWHCWHRTQSKRVMRLLNVRGSRILKTEPWSRIKCFHGGGEAKWWIPDAADSGMFLAPGSHTEPTQPISFVELTRSDYDREQSLKRVLRGLGYYSLFRTA
jgi:hypothetical protein